MVIDIVNNIKLSNLNYIIINAVHSSKSRLVNCNYGNAIMFLYIYSRVEIKFIIYNSTGEDISSLNRSCVKINTS